MARSKDADAPVKVTAREAADTLPAPTSGAQEFVQGAISRAAGLIDAKHAIQADLQQSRDFLAFAQVQGDASPEQVAWIGEYLPKRTKGANGATSDDGEA
jgi:hypothetical protein